MGCSQSKNTPGSDTALTAPAAVVRQPAATPLAIIALPSSGHSSASIPRLAAALGSEARVEPFQRTHSDAALAPIVAYATSSISDDEKEANRRNDGFDRGDQAASVGASGGASSEHRAADSAGGGVAGATDRAERAPIPPHQGDAVAQARPSTPSIAGAPASERLRASGVATADSRFRSATGLTQAELAGRAAERPQAPVQAPSAYEELLRERAPFPWRRGHVIGSGSYGAVFLGMNCFDGSFVAVKEMGLRAQDPTVCAALAREISTLRCVLSPSDCYQHDDVKPVVPVTVAGTEPSRTSFRSLPFPYSPMPPSLPPFRRCERPTPRPLPLLLQSIKPPQRGPVSWR